MKSLGYSCKSKAQSKITLNIDDQVCFDPAKVANFFNQFYTNVAETLVSKLPPSPKIFDTDSTAFKDFYREMSTKNFKLQNVSEDFILKELLNLKPFKSTGLDNIPSRFLKEGAEILKLPITHIVNTSISTNIVPSDFKAARVKPLHKKNSKLEVGNYRPVSILTAISKILEKAVYIQLESHLTDNNLLYDFQSGFRGAYSTDTWLIHLTEYQN